MPRSFRFFSRVFGAVLALGFFVPGAANAVPHDGIIIDGTSPGARFSFLHPASNNAGGGGPAISIPNGGVSSADIAYTWNPVGDPFVTGSTQTFDRGATIVWDTGGLIGGGGSFTLSLWENVSNGSVVATNTITAGAVASGSAQRNTAPAESVSNLHRATGDFGFTITDNGSGSVLSDIFFFGDMGANVIGIGDVSGDIDTFLWGKTASANSGVCDGDCAGIHAAFYGSHGLGIDIAYSGNTVAEPGALALLGIGLLGLGAARRQRSR